MNQPIASAAVPSACAGKSSAPVTDASTMLYVAITMSWSNPERADPQDLAGQQLPGADRREQDLDHPRRLLLDHAGRHPHPVAEQLSVQQDDGDERHRGVRLAVRILRLERLDRDGGRVQDLGDLVGRDVVGLERRPDAVGDHGGLHGALELARHLALHEQALPVDQDGVQRTVRERGVGGRHDLRPAACGCPSLARRLPARPTGPAAPTRPEQPQVERRRAAPPVRVDEDEPGEHGQRDPGRDHEPLVPQAIPEVTLRDEPPRPAVGLPRIGAHAAAGETHVRTASRNSSASDARSRLKCVTSPAPRARSSTRCSSTSSVQLQHDAVVRRVLDEPDAGDRVVPLVGCAGDLHAQPASFARRAQFLDRPCRDDPAVIDQDHAVAQPLDQLQLMAREHDRHAAPLRLTAEHPGERVDADGIEARERFVQDQHVRAGGRAPPPAGRAAGCRARGSRPDRSPAPRHPGPRWSRRPDAKRRAASAHGAAPGTPAARAPSSSGTGRAPPACTRSADAPPRRSGRPFHRTSPASGSRTPSAIRIVVVFPAPFGPTNPTISPSGIENVTPSSATMSPNRRERSSSSSMPSTGCARASASRGSPRSSRPPCSPASIRTPRRGACTSPCTRRADRREARTDRRRPPLRT